MALALSNQVPIEVSYIFIDDEENRATCKINLPTGLDDIALLATVQALGTRLAALSNGRLVAANATRKYIDAVAQAAVAPPESEVERKGRFNFVGAGNVKSSVEIPSVLLTLTPGKSDDIDLTNAVVADFVDAMINVALGVGNSPTDDKGNDLTAVKGAYEMHRTRARR